MLEFNTQNAVIKMSAGRLDGMMVSDSVFYHVTPGALAGALNRHTWRETIAKAREYLKQQAEHEQKVAKGEKVPPPRKPVGPDEEEAFAAQDRVVDIARRDDPALIGRLGSRSITLGQLFGPFPRCPPCAG